MIKIENIRPIIDAKSFLTRIRNQKYRLDELNYEKYLEQNGLILKAQDLTKPLVSGSRNSDLSIIPVHIEEYIEDIEREEKELYAMKLAGKRFIDIIPDTNRQNVLRYYYIDFLEWQQVAARMNYSVSYVFSLSASAIVYLNRRIRVAHIMSVQDCLSKILKKKIKDSSK